MATSNAERVGKALDLPMSSRTVLTIGHSDHSAERLLALLNMHAVTAVADVRSLPYSRLHAHFNKQPLQEALRAQGIAYVFLGADLGARSQDPSCYENGRVQYRKLAQTDVFKAGLERVLKGAESQRIALLCAEREPLNCHRALLVARELEALGAAVAHIHADGTLELHSAAIDRLLATFALDHPDMFRTKEGAIEEVYARQEQRVAYVDENLAAVARAVPHPLGGSASVLISENRP